MAYTAPKIDASGLHIPTYTDIRDYYVDQAKAIFGNDIHLENDSQDYQLISVLALAISDTLQAAQLAYNSFHAGEVVGAAQDALYKLNGITRKVPSYSTCAGIVLSGTPGAVITNGIVSDVNGNKWTLPSPITLNGSGLATVTGQCQTIGAITALTGDINKIDTPTLGWTSVTNNVAAVAGQPVELDSAFRARQAISTAIPSQNLLTGIRGGIATVSGVTRFSVLENDTNVTDANGLPGHSITCVVEGGTDLDVANQIYDRKTIGAGTNGTTEVTITDAFNKDMVIKFYRPSYVEIDVVINVTGLTGYTMATTDAIKAAVVNYLNALQIGESLTLSGIWYSALSVMPSITQPLFSITSLTAARHGETPGTSDILIDFNEVTKGVTANITVNVA